MTTRSRPRPRDATYTARLHQRTAAPRPVRRYPRWLTTRPLPALLALGAEAGHLVIAFTTWPEAPPAGLFHTVAAAAFGLLAVGVYCGHTRRELFAGVALGVAVPAAWLVCVALGIASYPWTVAIGLTVLEVTLTGLLLAAARLFT